MTFHVPEKFRVLTGQLASTAANGNNGAFRIPVRMPAKTRVLELNVVASDGFEWEHVSVSIPARCPTWEEMCQVKALFWDEEDCVLQFHPPASQYINRHKTCLHLWRPAGESVPTPPSWMVG
jgi:hypothetical protein